MSELIINLAALMTIFLGCFAFMWYLFYVTEKRWEAKLDSINESMKIFVKDLQSQRDRTDKVYNILIDLVSTQNKKKE